MILDSSITDEIPEGPVTLTSLQWLMNQTSHRLHVEALNTLAVILLGRERAFEDWTYQDLYEAARKLKTP